MQNFRIKLIVGYFIIWPYSFCQQLNCNEIKQIIFKFVDNPHAQYWDELENYSDTYQSCKCEVAPVLYFTNRMKVVLPNSQALQGISPNTFILSHKLRMKEQLEILKNCDEKDFMPLVNSMTIQSFDEEILNTANDIKKKMAFNIEYLREDE